MYSLLTALVNNLNGAGDHTVQWLIDIDHQYIVFIRTWFFQRFKLGHQHLRFEEVAFTRFQTAFDNVKIPFQIDEREVRVTVAQLVAIDFFQSGTDDQLNLVGTLHRKGGVVQRL